MEILAKPFMYRIQIFLDFCRCLRGNLATDLKSDSSCLLYGQPVLTF